MSYKWRPSKAAAAEYSAKMAEIEKFCREHDIRSSLTNDSYYFSLDGVYYRVSNHTVATSNRGAYNETGEQIRQEYHPDGENGMICITAGKTRIMEIYNDLAAGYKLDRRGNRINA